MAEYGRVYKNLWGKKRFRGLSDNGKLLVCYLFSCPHGTAVGAWLLHPEYVQADLGWTAGTVTKTVSELLDNGWLNRSETQNVVVIRDWFEFNQVQNPNQMKRCLADISELPRDEVYQVMIDDLQRDDNLLRDNYQKRLLEAFGERLPEPLPQRFRNGLGNPDCGNDALLFSSEAEAEAEAEAATSATIAPAALQKAVVEMYRKKLVPPLRDVQAIGGQRQVHLRARLKQHPDLKFWEELFARVKQSDFLLGKCPPGPGHSRPMKADFDWIINPTNLNLILEGKYDESNNGKRMQYVDMLPPEVS